MVFFSVLFCCTVGSGARKLHLLFVGFIHTLNMCVWSTHNMLGSMQAVDIY